LPTAWCGLRGWNKDEQRAVLNRPDIWVGLQRHASKDPVRHGRRQGCRRHGRLKKHDRESVTNLSSVLALVLHFANGSAGINVARYRQEPRENSLTELLSRADHLVTDGLREHAKEQGLTVTEYRVLRALVACDGMRMIRLAELALLKQATLTKAVERLERGQLVQRWTPTEDRRGTLVRLTERGQRLASLLLVHAREDERAVTRSLGSAANREIKGALIQLIRLLQEPQWPPMLHNERARSQVGVPLASSAQRAK
jgi:DNA-binding MarR family transcriptional regulator